MIARGVYPVAPESVPDAVRAACAWVAGRARSVRVEEAAIEAYARELEESAAGEHG